jgi:hypothetical protein
MTPGRRLLRYDSFDDILPDVERLLSGCSTVGNWSFAQICRHLSGSLRLTVDLPPSTPRDSSLWVGEELRMALFDSGILPEGFAAPPAIIPAVTLGPRSEVEELRESIAYYRASGGPSIRHLYLGPLTASVWDRFHLMHCAHHLSFAIPSY